MFSVERVLCSFSIAHLLDSVFTWPSVTADPPGFSFAEVTAGYSVPPTPKEFTPPAFCNLFFFFQKSYILSPNIFNCDFLNKSLKFAL